MKVVKTRITEEKIVRVTKDTKVDYVLEVGDLITSEHRGCRLDGKIAVVTKELPTAWEIEYLPSGDSGIIIKGGEYNNLIVCLGKLCPSSVEEEIVEKTVRI